MLTATKSPLSSLTITSSGGAAIASFLDVVGIHLGDGLTAADINAIIAGVGAVVAIIGRLRATKIISTSGDAL